VFNGRLKCILVTSQLTYVPGNYTSLFSELLKTSAQHIAGVIFLKNIDSKTLKSILGLGYLGAFQVQKTLMKNLVELPLQKRKKLLSRYEIPWTSFGSMNDPEVKDWVHKKEAHLIINARTRCIYKKSILNSVPLGCINVHHGILPSYRGTMSDLYALSEGRRAGFSIHKMNEKIDDGLIYHTEYSSKGHEKNYIRYLERSASNEGTALGRFILDVQKKKSLPDGQPNLSDEIVFTKNPTREAVKTMKSKGMIL